ncbi:MAG: DUF2007 domain-containing protein [Proteobacteria bacterium]|nr:DUF2007 domain-containing protein [Pseudomonadota bacterium]
MIELLRNSDAVKLSWLTAVLAGEGIEAVLLDQHMSVFAPAISQRLVVRNEDAARARRLLEELGELDGAA